MQTRPEGIAFLKAAKSLYPLETVEYLALNIPLGTQHDRFLHCAYSDVSLKPVRHAGCARPRPASTTSPWH